MTRFDMSAFSSRLQQTAATLLENSPPAQSRGLVARAVQEMAEIALARHQVNPQQIACRAGCGHCCIVNVAVLDPEADAILDFLRPRTGPAEQRRLARRAAELSGRIRGLDDEERILLRRSCLFLDGGGRCTIYPVRPLLCRALTSTDAERCRDAIAMVSLGEEVTILANLFQQELFSAAFHGLAAALRQGGFNARSQPLTTAMHARLNPAS